MIISDEQVRRVLDYLKASSVQVERTAERGHAADAQIVPKAVAVALAAPDVRHDRLEQARYVIEGFLPDGETVADKLIGRMISDSIR